MRKKRLRITLYASRFMWRILTTASLLVFFAYAVASYFLYHELTDINGRCDRHLANSPSAFVDLGNFWPPDFAYSQYYVAEYEQVALPSRDKAVTISGWWMEAEPDAPAILIVHGYGSCKYSHTVLVPAGMLVQHGFSVLAIDLRDAGDSTWQNGRSALGAEEYLDVLGAWDWLVDEKGLDPNQVGILGNSVGGRSGLVAMAEEERITAVFAESPPTNTMAYLQDEARRNNFPIWLLPGSLLWSERFGGVDLEAFAVDAWLPRIGSRAVQIIHSRGDEFVGVEQSNALANELDVVIVEEAGHMQIAAQQTAVYEEALISFFTEALKR
ncbi:MAG: alpha/beta fold hydrolase [Chloroflexota bacterium]